MTLPRRRTLLKLAAVVMSLCLLVPALACGGLLTLNYIEEQRALQIVASHLGTEPDWDAVRFAVYCEVVAKGASRQQVERELRGVGKYRSFYSLDEGKYVFNGDTYLRPHLGAVTVRYSSNRVIDVWMMTEAGATDTVTTRISCVRRKTSV
jgi:hypothetical protein